MCKDVHRLNAEELSDAVLSCENYADFSEREVVSLGREDNEM